MFSIIKDKTTEAKPLKEDLSELLMELHRYGHPRVSHLTGGWHSSVEMNTHTEGADFIIRSDFNMPTPWASAKQCHERILKSLEKLNK